MTEQIPFLIYIFFIASNGELTKHTVSMPYPPGVPVVPGINPPAYTYNTYKPSQVGGHLYYLVLVPYKCISVRLDEIAGCCLPLDTFV